MDLNRNAKPPSRTISLSFDTRDPVALIAKEVEKRVKLFTDPSADVLRVNHMSNSLPESSAHVITMNALYEATDSLMKGLATKRFDVVFDGIGEGGYRRSIAALKRGGLLCAYGYSAGVQAQRRMLTMLMWIARLYLWRWLPGGKRAQFYSINIMRARHPSWFREDPEQLFSLLATRSIRPRIAERISFDGVLEAHRRLEKGGLEGKLVLCPESPLRHAA